jgi:hypothetical protein
MPSLDTSQSANSRASERLSRLKPLADLSMEEINQLVQSLNERAVRVTAIDKSAEFEEIRFNRNSTTGDALFRVYAHYRHSQGATEFWTQTLAENGLFRGVRHRSFVYRELVNLKNLGFLQNLGEGKFSLTEYGILAAERIKFALTGREG